MRGAQARLAIARAARRTGELSETEDVELARLHKEGFEPRSPTAAAAAANKGEAQGTAAGEELLLTPSREPSGAGAGTAASAAASGSQRACR